MTTLKNLKKAFGLNLPFVRVYLDFGSDGNAYSYNVRSKIPTRIEYGRIYNGVYEKGKVTGDFSNQQLHDIVFLIKRGAERHEIDNQTRTEY